MTSKFIYDIETTGLNPATNRIICISVKNLSSGSVVSFYGADEKKILTQFQSATGSCDELIGFCNSTFDWPFIKVRSVVNSVKMLNFPRQFDLRKGLFDESRLHGTLSELGKAMGYPLSVIKGSDMPEFYRKKKWPAIVMHCEDDVKLTSALYFRLNAIGLVGEVK